MAPAPRRAALFLAGLAALTLSPSFTAAQPAGAKAEPDVFTIARVRYRGGGDWYSGPSTVPNLLRGLRERFGWRTAEREGSVEPLESDLFEYPFLLLNGHGRVIFSEEEAARLRQYLTGGGFLFANDDYGMDESFRPALRRIFPDKELVEVPFDHPVFQTPYTFPHGLPKIHEHHGGPPKGYGIFHQGRMVVFYAYNTDIGDGLEDPDVHRDPPEVREQAMRMAINIAHYALTN